MSSLRLKTYQLFEQSSDTRLGRAVDIFLVLLIVANVLAVILETLEPLYQAYHFSFALFEVFSVFVFTVEYGLRWWASTEAPDEQPEQSAMSKRWKFMRSPAAIIDLIAIAPFYLTLFYPGIDTRILRVLRILRILKLTRYSTAMNMLIEVLQAKVESFMACFFILFVLLVLAASGAYLAENDAQPEAFGSIPHAMWWAVATLTTVGYGDVTPVTVLGKTFGALVTITGIGMAALPAGILASGLADLLAQRREALKEEYRHALEDGIIDIHEQSALDQRRHELGLTVAEANEIMRMMHARQAARQSRNCPHCGKPLSG